jgi:GNAT superfamily N-acetyltransferase
VLRIRELESADADFLGAMLYAAVYWDPAKERLPAEFVLSHPQLTIFHEGWGRPGDAGLVAEVDGEPVGVVWYRLFTEAEHGEGFVDEATPELAISVADGHRGEGIGRALLEAIHEQARSAGLARISLSVDTDNPAKRLYARLGYAEYEPGDDLGRMILTL